jgi:clan AA aspartic protease (TIGR02281 family)
MSFKVHGNPLCRRRGGLFAAIAWQFLLCAAVFSVAVPSRSAEAAARQVHGGSLYESLDFYQYTDNEGGIHFVDSIEKVPGRYRSKVTVRKDTPAARQTTRIVVDDNLIHVPAIVRNGDRAEAVILLLDTGTAMTTITEELATRLGIDLATTRSATIRLADGTMVNVRVARIDAVSVGARTKSPIEVVILPHVGSRELHDGLLGLDFLGEFQYQIDLANGLLRWQ